MSTQRRLKLTRDYHHARRMGFKFPQQMCKPVRDAGVLILDTAVMCAAEAIIPGASGIAKAIAAGKKVADTLGVMKTITDLKTKAENFIVSKFLGIFGCKLRRMFGFGSIVSGIKNAAGAVGNAVKGAASAVGGAVSKAAQVVGNAGKFVIDHVADIAKVVCPVVKPLCNPGCA